MPKTEAIFNLARALEDPSFRTNPETRQSVYRRMFRLLTPEDFNASVMPQAQQLQDLVFGRLVCVEYKHDYYAAPGLDKLRGGRLKELAPKVRHAKD